MPLHRRRPRPIYSFDFTKENIALGLAQGRALIELQECDPLFHKWIEELIEEGKAFASEWYDKPYTKEVYRTIYQRPLQPGEKVKKDAI